MAFDVVLRWRKGCEAVVLERIDAEKFDPGCWVPRVGVVVWCSNGV